MQVKGIFAKYENYGTLSINILCKTQNLPDVALFKNFDAAFPICDFNYFPLSSLHACLEEKQVKTIWINDALYNCNFGKYMQIL